jgi:SAM-dependent methyltransferase
MLASHGARVVAIDISSSVELVQAEGAHLPNLYTIQADLFHLPLRDRVFDVVWSDGVIHHTPTPSVAFSVLAAKIAVGGRLSIYVYPQVMSVYKQVRQWTPMVCRWPLSILQAYCRMTAMVIYLARIIVGKRQPYHEVNFRLFDTLACPYLSTHSLEEVVSWYEQNQFHQVKIGRPYITAIGIKKPDAYLPS